VLITGCHNEALVAKYPMTSCVMSSVTRAGLDVSCNADVREYLAAVVDDLSNTYSLDAVE